MHIIGKLTSIAEVSKELPERSAMLEVNMKVEAIKYEGRSKVSAGNKRQMADKVHLRIRKRAPAHCTLLTHTISWS
jgi:hypothetical protein